MARMIRFAAGLLALSPTLVSAQRAPIDSIHIVRVDASSTSEARLNGRPVFTTDHLVDKRDWSAWGSKPNDARGAWVSLDFDAVQYLDRLEFVPGNARDKSTFESCGRPARIRVEAGESVRTLSFKDRRYIQQVALDPPIAARHVRLVFEAIYGRGRRGGVCLSELRLSGPADPRAAVPGLAGRIQAAINELADDARARRAKRALVKIGAPALPELREALDATNPNLTVRALEVLGEMGDRRAIRAVAPFAKSDDREVAEAALWALGALRSEAHFDLIHRWFQRSRGPARDRAFDALARTGDDRALEVVIAQLVGGNASTRRAAETYLGRYGRAAVEALQPLLDSPRHDEQEAALRALGTVDHPEARERLLGGLLDPTPSLRAAAVHGLAVRGDAEARAHILPRWQSTYNVEREAVAEALGRVGQPEDLEILELLTSDTSMSVREAAAYSLGHMGAKAASLLRRLGVSGPDGATALAAAKALVEMPEAEPVDAAVHLLASRFKEVRAFAGATLTDQGARGRVALVAAVVGDDDSIRGGATAELKRSGRRSLPALLAAAPRAPEAAQAALLELMVAFKEPMAANYAAAQLATAKDLIVRRAAVRVLAATGGPVAEVALLSATEDKASEVRTAVFDALGALHVVTAVARLVAALDDPSIAVRRAAARSLGQIRNRVALDELAGRYNAARGDRKQARLREDLVVAIGRIGGTEGLDVLVDAMSDTDKQVRAAAQRALQ